MDINFCGATAISLGLAAARVASQQKLFVKTSSKNANDYSTYLLSDPGLLTNF